MQKPLISGIKGANTHPQRDNPIKKAISIKKKTEDSDETKILKADSTSRALKLFKNNAFILVVVFSLANSEEIAPKNTPKSKMADNITKVLFSAKNLKSSSFFNFLFKRLIRFILLPPLRTYTMMNMKKKFKILLAK